MRPVFLVIEAAWFLLPTCQADACPRRRGGSPLRVWSTSLLPRRKAATSEAAGLSHDLSGRSRNQHLFDKARRLSHLVSVRAREGRTSRTRCKQPWRPASTRFALAAIEHIADPLGDHLLGLQVDYLQRTARDPTLPIFVRPSAHLVWMSGCYFAIRYSGAAAHNSLSGNSSYIGLPQSRAHTNRPCETNRCG